jgi:hypothetical protein
MLAMLTAAAIGVLSLQGLAAASPLRATSADFVVVAGISGDRMRVYKADPRTLKRVSAELTVPVAPEPATRPRFPMSWALSPGRKQLALSIERELSRMELEVIDLTRMKLLRSLRTDVRPIVWPSPHRLGGAIDVPDPGRFLALDPETGAVVQEIRKPDRVPQSSPGPLVATGVFGGPVRVLRLDAPKAFQVVTFARLRGGIEPFLGGGGRLPPGAKLAVARAQAAAGVEGRAELVAVAPFLAPDSSFGCAAGGLAIRTWGYRVVFRQDGWPVEYRVGTRAGSSLTGDTRAVRCDEPQSGPLRPEANMLTAPRPTWYVTGPEFALDRTGGLVALTSTAVARQSTRPLRTRYRSLRPRLPGLQQAASVRPRFVATLRQGSEAALVDTQTGRTRVFGRGDLVAVSGGNILVLDRNAYPGLSVYDPAGHLRFRALAGRQVGELQAFGGYAYVTVGPTRQVVSLRTGRVVARVPYGRTLLLPRFL